MIEKSDTQQATDLALRFVTNRGLDSDRATFLEALVVFVTQTLGVKYAFVANYDDADPVTVNTLALAENASVLPNVSYPLAGSPCEDVITEGVCQTRLSVQDKYPEDPMLVDLGIQAYVGVLLPSTSGVPAGHLAIMHCDELSVSQNEIAKQILSILSSSVAWELDRIEQEANLKKNERRFKDFAAASSDWYWETDQQHRFTYVSSKVFEGMATNVEMYYGKTRWEISQNGSDNWEEHIETLNRHEPFKNFEYEVVAPNNERNYSRVSGVPMFDEKGIFAGYRGSAQQVTDQKLLLIALENSEARYERAMQHAAIWEWEIPESEFFVSLRMRKILGYDQTEFDVITKTFMQTLVHPDDLTGYHERLNTALAFPDTIYESEHRLRQKSGKYKWFETRGTVVANADGEAIRMSGLILDISDRKEMEQSLNDATERAIKAERQLLGAINSIQDGFAIFDTEDKLLMCNETYKKYNSPLSDILVPGVSFEALARKGVKTGHYQCTTDEDNWVQERLSAFHSANQTIEYSLGDGTRLRASEHKTPDNDTVCIRTDVTLFRESQEIAESANKAKSEFLSSMSHELRTPLNAILGFGQLLRNDGKKPLSDAQQRAVKHILNSGGHLLTLIDEVLDLAKIEAGQERMSIENTAMSDVIESCLSLVQSTADKHGIKIAVNLDPEHSVVMADYTRVKQVLVNLLTNGIKYNNENGSVTLASNRKNDKIQITVTDSGPGIPKDRFEELFHPFARLGAETSEIEGTGIGLTICKRLIELMDGTIGVESNVGEGSTFWIELPAGVSPVAKPNAESSASPEETQKPEEVAQTSRKHFSVLYVEDNPTNIRLMEQIIDLVSDAELRSTHTAENALEIVTSIDPDLILMDINLPGMNGIQALNRLRASPDTSSIPVIAISADAIPESIQRGLEAGFHAYLTKPIRVDEILDIIESIRSAD